MHQLGVVHGLVTEPPAASLLSECTSNQNHWNPVLRLCESKGRHNHAEEGMLYNLGSGVMLLSFAKYIAASTGLDDRSSRSNPREPAAGPRSPERAHRRLEI